MNNNSELIQKFKQAVIESSSDPHFIHYRWFVTYHLDIVDKIAHELLAYYPEADKEIVSTMVWLHDYGKTLDFQNQYAVTLSKGREKLEKIGFPSEFIDTCIAYVHILDSKMELDLRVAPIEVQIISSADGCSHYVGPFMSLWWLENNNKPFEELMADNYKKVMKDWDRKIVLPEARQAFEARYKILVEQSGRFPEKFIV